MTTPETVPVTDEDRQCAVDFVEAWKEGQSGEQVAALIAAHRIEATRELEDEVERLMRNVRGWVEWFRETDRDDSIYINCLNAEAWAEAKALASTGMDLIIKAELDRSRTGAGSELKRERR